MSTFLETAIERAERGAFVFPLRSSKRPRGKGWRVRGATPAQIAKWGPDVTGYGIDCESANYVVLDEDRPGAIAELEQRLGITLPPTLTIATGREGGGQHRIFHHDHEQVRISNSRPDGCPSGLDVRGAGGYIVGVGSQHFDSNNESTGNWYVAADDISPACLPDELVEWLSTEITSVAEPGDQSEQGELTQFRPASTEADRDWGREYLADACDRIRSEPEGGRNNKLRDEALPIGSLVKAGYVDSHEAVEALTESATEAGLPEDEARATIANAARDAKPNRGPRPAPTAEEMFEAFEDDVPGGGDLAMTERERKIRAELLTLEVRAEAKRRYAEKTGASTDLGGEYLTLDDLDALPPMPWYITGRLPEGYALLTGRDGTFKTFIALDMVLSIAAGVPWRGMPVTRARVLYVAGEGARNISNRVQAWLKVHPQVNRADLLNWFTVRTSAPNFYAAGPGYDDLMEHCRDYGVVVLDTLRRISGGADGNGSDMAVVVDRIADLIRVLDNGSGGLALVVAHTQKNDTDTRGYSGIEDDADTVLHTRREGASLRVTLEVSKQKDGEDGGKDQLSLTSVGVTPTASSLSVDPNVSQVVTTGTHKQQRERLIMEHLDAVKHIGSTPAEVVAALGSGYNRTTVNKHLSELVGQGSVEKQGTHYFPGSPTAEAEALGFDDETLDSGNEEGGDQ